MNDKRLEKFTTIRNIHSETYIKDDLNVIRNHSRKKVHHPSLL